MAKLLINMFVIASIVIAVSLVAAFPSFKLAPFGDDWNFIWNYFHYLGLKASLYNHFTYFIGGYGAFEIMTGLLYSIFGHDYKMYYLFSYLYKLIAAFSVWPLIFYLTRSKLAAFYASLFLSVTTIGLESTNWVTNSPSYLATANLALFLYFFIKSRENIKSKSFLAAILFFYFAHIFAPIRMTGLLPFTFFLEIFLNFKYPNVKLSFLRLSIILLTFAIISTTGATAGKTGRLLTDAFGVIGSGFSTISTLLKQERSDFLFYPIMTIGRLVIPYTIKPQIFTLLLYLSVFISFLVLNIPRGKKIISSIIVILGIWTLISWLIYTINKSTLSLPDALSLAVGGYTLVFGIILMIFSLKQTISISFFIGVFWTIFSFIFTWVRAPETLHPTEHRYLTSTMVGITILFASIIGLGNQVKNRINLFILVLPFIILNIITTRGFFIDVVENSHGADAINKIYSTLPYIPEIGKTKKPFLFYFESTPEKGALKHHSLTFGFPYRMAVMYNIQDEDLNDSLLRMPMSTNDWKDVVSAVSDKQYADRNDFINELVPIENIYAFYLDNNNNLINITQEARNKLKEEISSN